MQIELNDAEATMLMEALNITVKSIGLEAAANCLHLANKITEAKKVAAMPAGGIPAPTELDEAA